MQNIGKMPEQNWTETYNLTPALMGNWQQHLDDIRCGKESKGKRDTAEEQRFGSRSTDLFQRYRCHSKTSINLTVPNQTAYAVAQYIMVHFSAVLIAGS